MRSRVELLKEIISNPRPNSSVIQELAEYGLDFDRHLVNLSRAEFLNILRMFEAGELSETELKTWAERLVKHHDIGYEFGDEGVLEEAVFLLAHEEIYGMADIHLCQRIEAMLERRSPERAQH